MIPLRAPQLVSRRMAGAETGQVGLQTLSATVSLPQDRPDGPIQHTGCVGSTECCAIFATACSPPADRHLGNMSFVDAGAWCGESRQGERSRGLDRVVCRGCRLPEPDPALLDRQHPRPFSAAQAAVACAERQGRGSSTGPHRPARIEPWTRNDPSRSAFPAARALVMHLAKAIFQPPALFAIRRGVGQTIADVVFYVSQVLAMLPTLAIAIPLPVLRARSGHPRYRDLHIRLSRRPPLSTDRLRERA